jgi:hypothetical protein
MTEGLKEPAMVTGLVADVVRTLAAALIDVLRTLATALAHSSTALAMGAVLVVALVLIGLVIRIAWLFAVVIAAVVILSLFPHSVGTALQAPPVVACHRAAVTCGGSTRQS